MAFPWLTSQRAPGRPAGYTTAASAELRDRAALFSRLGFTAADASRRLQARVAWEHELTRRPAALDDAAISALVDEVYKRQRP